MQFPGFYLFQDSTAILAETKQVMTKPHTHTYNWRKNILKNPMFSDPWWVLERITLRAGIDHGQIFFRGGGCCLLNFLQLLFLVKSIYIWIIYEYMKIGIWIIIWIRKPTRIYSISAPILSLKKQTNAIFSF